MSHWSDRFYLFSIPKPVKHFFFALTVAAVVIVPPVLVDAAFPRSPGYPILTFVMLAGSVGYAILRHFNE